MIAPFLLHGVGGECNCPQQDQKVQPTCAGETTEFTVGDDGALFSPA
jgi:hypothetical protein